jgi:hypothetical protein
MEPIKRMRRDADAAICTIEDLISELEDLTAKYEKSIEKIEELEDEL